MILITFTLIMLNLIFIFIFIVIFMFNSHLMYTQLLLFSNDYICDFNIVISYSFANIIFL